MPLLEVSGLTITLQTPRGRARAVQNLEFILERGATLGLMRPAKALTIAAQYRYRRDQFGGDKGEGEEG